MWWEKTVEYSFIIAASQAGKLDFAAPLSGAHEHTAGDSIFGVAEEFILVEFKRDSAEIPTERSLFIDYIKACKSLIGYSHHYFVYGKKVADSKSPGSKKTLTLRARPYFTRKFLTEEIDVEKIADYKKAKPVEISELDNALDVLGKGVCKKIFDEYLEKLAELKHGDKRSGGHVSPEQMSAVIGITKNREIVSTQTLYEYLPRLFPKPVKRIDHSVGSNIQPH